jgi:SAM-dependent methyltransferase
MAEKLGSNRVEFVKGQIQDLALDLESMNKHLGENPIHKAEDILVLRDWQDKQRRESPLIKDNSVDLVISNCVLNLVHDSDKEQLVQEIFRVVKPGGRVAISDIVSDEHVPEHLKQDQQLWSGCISGALQEHDMLAAFVKAGFVGVCYDKWENQPWQVVEGIEFRAITITAIKPLNEPCIDKGHAVIYRGPFSEVYDDEGHVYYRGQRMAVCERSYKFLTGGTYGDSFIGIAPAEDVPGTPWNCPSGSIRSVLESKSGIHENTCSPSGGCC